MATLTVFLSPHEAADFLSAIVAKTLCFLHSNGPSVDGSSVSGALRLLLNKHAQRYAPSIGTQRGTAEKGTYSSAKP